MKIAVLFWTGIFAGWTAGCVQSHQAAPVAVYEPVPGSLTPTSDRPTPRVYAPSDVPASTPAVPAPSVNDSDVRLGENISHLLKGNPHLAGASANVIVTIKNGVVTLHGTVPAEPDREEIAERVSHVPGVAHVNDRLGVEGER